MLELSSCEEREVLASNAGETVPAGFISEAPPRLSVPVRPGATAVAGGDIDRHGRTQKFQR